jgi:hypothetical protein
MDFNEFLNEAWKDHAHKTVVVATRIPEAFAMIETHAQIASLAHLITHVFGEHLGDWGRGLELLDKLTVNEHANDESRAAVARATAALRLAQHDGATPEGFSDSDRARIYSMAAAARASNKDTGAAEKMFETAERIAQTLHRNDPAHRAIAITANNLAVGFEETPGRTPEQTAIMVRAATIALEKWQMAGGPAQVQTANYRMAKTLIQAGQYDEAMAFALACHRVGVENSASPIDMFYAHEVLALAAQKLANVATFKAEAKLAEEFFEQMSDDDKKWARPDLEKLQMN